MSETLIKVENVSKKFCRNLKRSLWYGLQDLGNELLGRPHGGDGELRKDEFWAVRDVSFELKRGECLGVIGRNGAGKTTLLRILNGLIKPDIGYIEIQRRIGALIALGAGFNPVLTGLENIYVNAAVLGFSKREIDKCVDEIIDFAEIREFIDSPVQSYSTGMVVRLGFAIAIKTEPDILLLDEVLAVGDVSFQAKCFNKLAELRRRGTGFILVSHNMRQISRYADQVLYLSKGQVKYLGEPERGLALYLKEEVEETGAALSNDRLTGESGVLGSGKVIFTDAKFLNGSGEVVPGIDVGEGVTLAIEFERRSSSIKNPILDLNIRYKDDLVFQGTNIVSGQPFGDLPLKGRFEINFTALPVNVSRLDFSFALLDCDSVEIYDWKRGLSLAVRPSHAHHGKLVMPVKWSISSVTE